MNSSNEKIPIKTALRWIFGSVLLISGTAAFGLFYYKHVKEMHKNDDKYRIIAIVQSTSSREPFKTSYFAELLNLSVDRPTNLYQFNSREARRTLLQNPLIKSAQVKKIRPGTVYIEYEMRTPIAFLTDYSNTAIDNEGWLFPVRPFLTPKRLPEIYLGLGNLNNPWGICVKNQEMQLALNVLHHLKEHCDRHYLNIKRIDAAQAYSNSYGHRQVVVILEDVFRRNNEMVKVDRILRLSTDDFKQGLANYLVLREQLPQNSVIVDFRLSDLAFVKG